MSIIGRRIFSNNRSVSDILEDSKYNILHKCKVMECTHFRKIREYAKTLTYSTIDLARKSYFLLLTPV